MRLKNLWTLLAVGVLSFGLVAGCGDDDGAGTNENENPYPCNNDGTCDPDEDRAWCADCAISCDLQEGDNYDYIISQLVLPESSSDEIGVDLDGDGTIDNKLGALLSLVPSDPGTASPNEAVDASIQNGSIVMLGRLVVSDWTSDEAMAVQVFQGDTTDATEDNFDVGNNNASIAPDFDRTLHLCGELTSGYVEAGPSDLVISLTFGGIDLNITLNKAQVVAMESPMTEDDWTDVMIGGGVSKETINNDIIPVVVDFLNEETIADPEGGVGSFVTGSLDGDCSSVPEGCESVVAGEGECAVWDPNTEPDGPVITETEIRCSNLFATALKPDVDSDGDGEKDLVSLGVMVSAVSITIDN